MKKRLIIFVSLMLVLLTSAVSGADFAFTSEQALQKTCPTMFTVYQFTVTNIGDEADTYTVSKSGSAAPWALISPPGFVLQPGGSQTIYVYVTPSKGAQIGNYDLDLTVSAGKGGTLSSSVLLAVDECHRFSLSSNKEREEICTGESTEYLVTVQNDGQWNENLRLSLAGAAAVWSSVSEEFLKLDKGESRIVSVFVSPEANEVGDFELSVTALSLDSDAIATKELDLHIAGCFGLELDVKKNFYSLCENSQINVPVTVKNTGTAINTYNLAVDGPEWAAMELSKVSLGSGADKTVNVVLYPGYGIIGSYPIRVTAVSENGDKTADAKITANVMQCHGVRLSISDEEDSICPQAATSYEIGLMNTGNVTERFGLLLNGPTWASIDTAFVTLAPQKHETIMLAVDPPTNIIPGQYAISVEAQSQEASRVSDKDTLILNIAPKESCFGVRTTAERSQVRVAYGEGLLLPIVVENQGSETATYSFDISGDGAEFAQLNPSSVTIDGNSADTVYLYIAVPDKTQKQVYMIIVSARDEGGIVSSASTVYVHVTEETEQIPEILPAPINESENKTVGTFFSSISDSISSWFAGVTGWFSSLGLPSANETEEPEEPALSDETAAEPESNVSGTGAIGERFEAYWYWVFFVIIIIVLGYIYTRRSKTETDTELAEFEELKKPSGWQRFKSWFEEDEEIELIDELEEPKKPKRKAEKKEGAWQRFTAWLEADEELTEKPAKKKAKPKKKERSGWDTFKEWLEEEDEPKEKPAKLVKKARTKKAEKGFWQKFADWLEEDEPEKKKPKKPEKPKKEKQKPKKKGKSGWDSFKSWLEEE